MCNIQIALLNDQILIFFIPNKQTKFRKMLINYLPVNKF